MDFPLDLSLLRWEDNMTTTYWALPGSQNRSETVPCGNARRRPGC